MIAIIGDLHDNLKNFENFLKKTLPYHLSALWSVGDLGTPESYQSICEQFSGPILAVPGNVETGHDVTQYREMSQQHPHLVWQAEPPLLVTETKFDLIAALFHFPQAAERYSQAHTVDILVSGHTHQPKLVRFGTGWHVNPGTLGGVFTPATYVILDLPTRNFRLERLY